MPSSQLDTTRESLGAVCDFLGGPTADGDEWCFEFGEQLRSNWGDVVHGGALAAGMLAVARAVAPERSPRSLHVQIVRSVPSGWAWATAIVRHPGRTVATVEVDLYDQRRKLAAIALMTMVTPDAVAAQYDRTLAAPPFRVIEVPLPPVPESANRADHRSTQVRHTRRARGTQSRKRAIECGWLACRHLGVCRAVGRPRINRPGGRVLVADAAVGLRFMDSDIALEYVGPNADLTLRFTTAPATRAHRGRRINAVGPARHRHRRHRGSGRRQPACAWTCNIALTPACVERARVAPTFRTANALNPASLRRYRLRSRCAA